MLNTARGKTSVQPLVWSIWCFTVRYFVFVSFLKGKRQLYQFSSREGIVWLSLRVRVQKPYGLPNATTSCECCQTCSNKFYWFIFGSHQKDFLHSFIVKENAITKSANSYWHRPTCNAVLTFKLVMIKNVLVLPGILVLSMPACNPSTWRLRQ